MTSKRRILPLLAVVLLIWENVNSIDASSLPQSASSSHSTSELLMSLPLKNTEISTPSVSADESNARKKAIGTGPPRDKTKIRDPPASPVKLFMPDEFQFYTLNNYGQLVMKQMTKQEIQGMIAASVGGVGNEDGAGDPLKEPGKHHPVPVIDGVPKVSDVVQNVQKVLKGELNKPVQVRPPGSSIPGNVNSQWTNMLPYILSGGSVDQQDVAQDTSIILPTLDVDQTYIDVVPLQGSKPANDHYESGSNYVQQLPNSQEQEIKVVTHKQTLNTSEKPIYLLGNMALDSDILEEQNTYTVPTRDRPHRPSLTSLYQKFTTAKPFVTKHHHNAANSTKGKPTMYIPLSISTLHNKNHLAQMDIYKIPGYTTQEKHATLDGYETDSTTIGIPPKKTTANDYPDNAGFTRVPVFSPDKVDSSTQRINQHKTPVFEKLPTTSPELISSTLSFGTKLNTGSTIGNFKKPGTGNRPGAPYHSVYETVTKPSTIIFPSESSYYPVHDASTKPNPFNVPSPTYRPVYRPIIKTSTAKPLLPIHRPLHESITRPNIVGSASFTRPINESASSSISHKPQYSPSLHEISTASTSEPRIPQYSSNTYQAYTTEKSSPLVLDIVKQTSTQNVALKVTKAPVGIQDTVINNENKGSPSVHMSQQVTQHEKYSNKNTENAASNLSNTPLYNSNKINQIIGSTTSSFINNYSYNTVEHADTTNKLTEITTENTEWNKVFYEFNKEKDNTYHTTIPDKIEFNNKLASINDNIIKNSNQSEVINTIASSQEEIMKTENYNKFEESSTYPAIKIETLESKIENNDNHTTRHPEIKYKPTDTTPIEVTETIATNYVTYSVNDPNIDGLKGQNQLFSSDITYKPENIDKNTYIEIVLKNNTEASTNEFKEPSAINSEQVNKPEKIASWIQSELTTQFIPTYEGTTEYNMIKYDFDEVNNSNASAYEEPSGNVQETTIMPLKNNKITYQPNDDSTIEYSTPLNKIIDVSYVDYSKQSFNERQTTKPTSVSNETVSKISENSVLQSDNVDLNKSVYDNAELKDLDSKITTPAYVTSYEIKPTNNDKFNADNFVSDNKTKDSEGVDSVTDYNNNSEVTVSVNENKTMSSNLNAFGEPIDIYNIKSEVQYSTILPEMFDTENNFDQFNSFNISNATLVSEKAETTTKEFNKYTTEFITEYDKIKLPYQEYQVSTIKVIPIYDDDTSMYTLPPSYSSQTTSKTTLNAESTENSFSTMSLSTNKIIQSLQSNNQQKYKPIYQPHHSSIFSITTTPQIQNYVTQSTPAYDTILPDLQEAFDNYIKNNYNTKLSTTENYNEVSHLTTFSTTVDEISSGSTNHLTTLTTLDNTKSDMSKDQIISQKFNLDSTTIIPKSNGTETTNDFSSTLRYTSENFDSSKTEQNSDFVTKNTDSKETYSTEYLYDISPTFTTQYPVISNTNKAEIPTIPLEYTNRDSDKETNSYQSNDNTNVPSFTTIKIKNPVLDIEKIISEAPIQEYKISTVHYTLSNQHKSPNNIASGLIAGYPTYNNVNPTTEYVTDPTLYDNVSEVSTLSTHKDSAYYTLNTDSETVVQNDKNFSYQDKSTTLTVENDKNYVDKTSPIPIYITAGEETSTYSNQPSEATNFESHITVPLASLPIPSKTEIPSQDGEKYGSSLDKISDLINQLQDKPSDRNTTGHEYSNGVTTTIIPLDRFETTADENNSTHMDVTHTTVFDNTNKVSMESKNNTYAATQILSYIKPYQSSTAPTGHYNSTRIKNIEDKTTPSIFKVKFTTPESIMIQPVTGKPQVTSTHSSTKGLLDKAQSTIDKSAGRINLEEEKNKIQKVKPTEPTKFTMKNKIYYTTDKRPTSEAYQSYTRKITRPINKATTAFIKEHTTSKPITVTKDNIAEKWTQIPQKNIVDQIAESKQPPAINKEMPPQLNSQIVSLDHATGAIGLDQSNKGLDKDVAEFLNMCNELSFKFWTLANSELSSSRSLTLSPFGMISTLAMIFLGARGLTSNQMNDILKLDDVVTFNPHLVFQNITDTVTLARGQGIQNAAFVRALFADRLKVRKIMPFYKEQAQQFYEGAVVDINFSTAGDILRRRTNLLIRKQTGGRIKDFVKTHTVPLRSPLTALSANVFQTSCDGPDASSEGRDGEMYFAVSQTVKQRKLVPIPAVVWKSGVSAGYEPSLDATAVALGDTKRPVSLIMVMPGQQGLTAAGDNLERLEHRLFGNPSDNALEKLLKVIVPRRVEIQMPKFSHRSIVNITSALKKLGFDQLFTKTADLKGINGAGHDLYLADMLQMNLFYTCNDDNKLGGRPLSETFPGTPSRHVRAWQTINNAKTGSDDYLGNNEPDDAEVGGSSSLDDEDDCEDSLSLDDSSPNENAEVLQFQHSQLGETDGIYNLRQKVQKRRLWWFPPPKQRRCRRNRRQAEAEKPRMKMDKPFLYLIRHNLTGLILHIGRFNPKNQS